MEDIQWFTYWIVYAAFSVADMIQDLVLRWIPLYFLEKVHDFLNEMLFFLLLKRVKPTDWPDTPIIIVVS